MASISPTPALPLRARGALELFNTWADEMLDEWVKLQQHKPARRAESPNAWFKREAYRVIGHYAERGLIGVLRRNFKDDSRPTRLVEEALKNPFKLGLLAMFSDDEILTKSNRHVFGNQMLYAWAHDVPPEFLNGFLAISGGPNQIAAKLKVRSIEPGFEHRFKIERIGGLED